MPSFHLFLVREARGEDAAALAAFAARLFHETYEAHNRPEDMASYVQENFTVDRLRSEIESPRIRFFLVEADGELAAYAMLRQGDAPPAVAADVPVELARVYVDSRWQGAGVAPRLFEHCLDAARAWGADALWLAVWRENRRAIRFYQKQEMEVVGTQEFRLGEDVQEDYVMVRRLEPFGAPTR